MQSHTLDVDSLNRCIFVFIQTFGNTAPTLVIGQRINVNISQLSEADVFLPQFVETVAQRGQLFREDAEDYFFINRNVFPWDKVPDIAVGRRAYDNFIVGIGIMNGVSAIDATKTVTAVHQTDQEGNFAGHVNPEPQINVDAIGPFDYSRGHTTNSQYCTEVLPGYNNSEQGTRAIGVFKRDGHQLLVAYP
jgi:hypothetical protein